MSSVYGVLAVFYSDGTLTPIHLVPAPGVGTRAFSIQMSYLISPACVPSPDSLSFPENL